MWWRKFVAVAATKEEEEEEEEEEEDVLQVHVTIKRWIWAYLKDGFVYYVGWLGNLGCFLILFCLKIVGP